MRNLVFIIFMAGFCSVVSAQSDDWGYNMMKAVELLNDSDDAGALEYVENERCRCLHA